MTIHEFTNLPLDERYEVARKIAQTTILPIQEVERRLSLAVAAFEARQYELPIVVAQILVELDRIKEI